MGTLDFTLQLVCTQGSKILFSLPVLSALTLTFLVFSVKGRKEPDSRHVNRDCVSLLVDHYLNDSQLIGLSINIVTNNYTICWNLAAHLTTVCNLINTVTRYAIIFCKLIILRTMHLTNLNNLWSLTVASYPGVERKALVQGYSDGTCMGVMQNSGGPYYCPITSSARELRKQQRRYIS